MNNLITTNKEVQIYNFIGFSIRVVMINGEPWFVAKDVCDVLGLDDTGRVVSRLDIDESRRIEIGHPQSVGKVLEVYGINEPGLYSLILGSRKPVAKQFKRWVTHDVVPSIRKKGSYSVQSQPQFMLPQNYVEALEALLASVKENQVLLPKAKFHDQFLDSSELTSMTVMGTNYLGGMSGRQVAKFLQDQGVLRKRKVDNCYVPRQGYEHCFQLCHYEQKDRFGNPKEIPPLLKLNNVGIDCVVDLYKRSMS